MVAEFIKVRKYDKDMSHFTAHTYNGLMILILGDNIYTLSIYVWQMCVEEVRVAISSRQARVCVCAV